MQGGFVADSVYKVIELVGTSSESWEKAAEAALNEASKTVRDLRVAEISAFDIAIEDGNIKSYRAKLKASFKVETEQ
jgi:flavin-binding protein dodecin